MELECPHCGSHEVKSKQEEFSYQQIVYLAPVRLCGICNFAWTDWEKEDAEEKAFLRWKEVSDTHSGTSGTERA